MNNKQTSLQQAVRNRYNPEYFHDKSVELQEATPREECIAWYNHPCTEALRSSLEGDLALLVIELMGGAFLSADTTASTAQQYAKVVGGASAINDVLESIQKMKDKIIEGEEY